MKELEMYGWFTLIIMYILNKTCKKSLFFFAKAQGERRINKARQRHVQVVFYTESDSEALLKCS